MSYIGSKQIKTTENTGEFTPGNIELVRVIFEDGTSELFSDLMYQKIVSESACDASELREKRVVPVVSVLLAVLREWGIKLSELSYMSALLNQSLDANQKEAINLLWSDWIPKPNNPDEVDLIAIDRILKNKQQIVDEAIGK